MEPAKQVEIFGVALGLVVVFLLAQLIFPNDLSNTVMAVIAAP